ncbi:hypothetical protein [Mycetocola miduiensis]|uniref:DUF2975 domain-containing protein n=1 Tax=Mycetocola miduiensis TaxID=995034 RepID=A0A1I5BAL0_9MICO|nr:hypothetical protein [Mycetocola miduiensis]SFN71571.1 hypothetical protein SAMN05216219_1840 [Mycetocola miduiensis]
MQLDTTVRPTRSDRADLWTVIVVGAVVAAATIGFAVVRLSGILPNSAVEVLVPFVDTPASVPIGPDGALVPVAIDQGVLTVSNLSGFVIASLALAVLIDALMVLTIVACLGLLCRNLMRGRAFSRTNRRLVITTSVAIVVGTALGGLFQTIGVNGAFAAVGYSGYDSVVGTASLAPYFVATALAAVALAFKAGERLQREAEGLV